MRARWSQSNSGWSVAKKQRWSGDSLALDVNWTLGNLQGFDFARAGDQTFEDFAGELVTVGANIPAYPGLRYEGSVYHTDDEDGLPIPTTNNFGRNENNLISSNWPSSEFTSGDGVATDLGSGVARISLSGSGGRAFCGKNVDFVSGQTYCLSFRVAVESGTLSLGTLANLKTYATTSDSTELNINESGLFQIIFTATATNNKLVRCGLGIDGAETMAVSILVSDFNCRDVTGLENQNAPSEEFYGGSSFITSNANTVSSNKITEITGSSLLPVRAYNSGVIFGDSFTNDTIDLGTNIRELTGGVAVSSKGVAGHTLAQALIIMQAYTIKSTDNFFLIEGGVNDIAQSSTDPTAQMKLDQAAMVAIAVENGLQYQVYTIAPWKNHVGWTVEKQGWLETYNAWIHSTYPARRITDMYAILEDPSNADEMLAAYDSGDGLHPNAAGYLAVDTVTATKMSPNWRKGILLEDASTNEITDNTTPAAAWASVGTSPVDADITEGSLKFTKYSHDDTLSARQVAATFSSYNGGAYTWSVYVKEGTTPNFSIRLYDNTALTNVAYSHFSWTAGAVVLDSNVAGTSEVEDMGNGTFKVSVSAASTVNTNSIRAIFYPTKNGVSPAVNDYIHVNMGNIESGSFASSYIATSGATATRPKTSLTKLHDLPANNISFQVKVRPQFNYNEARVGFDNIVNFSDGTASNSLELNWDNTNDRIFLDKIVGGSSSAASTADDELQFSKNDLLNIRGVISAEDGLKLWVNDLAVKTKTTGSAKTDYTSLMTEISVGANEAGNANSFQVVGSLKIWYEAKSDEDMEALA